MQKDGLTWKAGPAVDWASDGREVRRTLAGTPAEPGGRALLVADWERALFMHFEMPPAVLQAHVPFPLDLFEGRAFVSLVAFTMRDMRLAWAGRLSRWLCAPFAEQRFLNFRTYVQCGGQVGIYFIAEWVSHGLCVPFGPMTYGLPYRWGRLAYEHAPERGVLRGQVVARRDGSALEYEAGWAGLGGKFEVSEMGTLSRFLLERYQAFTRFGKRRQVFRIAHAPWAQVPVPVTLRRDELLRKFAPWWKEARLVAANYSAGVAGVQIGRPHRVYIGS